MAEQAYDDIAAALDKNKSGALPLLVMGNNVTISDFGILSLSDRKRVKTWSDRRRLLETVVPVGGPSIKQSRQILLHQRIQQLSRISLMIKIITGRRSVEIVEYSKLEVHAHGSH